MNPNIIWDPEKLSKDVSEYVAGRMGLRRQIEGIREEKKKIHFRGTDFRFRFEERDGKRYLMLDVFPEEKDGLLDYVKEEIETEDVFKSSPLKKLKSKKEFPKYRKRLRYSGLREGDEGVTLEYRIDSNLFDLSKRSFRETVYNYAFKPFAYWLQHVR